jgi:hypothetical protein
MIIGDRNPSKAVFFLGVKAISSSLGAIFLAESPPAALSSAPSDPGEG